MRRPLLVLAVLVLVGGACSDDGDEARLTETTVTTTVTTTSSPGVELVDSYACGHGVAIGSADQTVGLFAYADGELSEPLPTDLSSRPWVAELRRGQDLFANWCTDLVSDPQAEIDERLAVVSGTIEVGADLDADFCSERVTAELHDVVVEGRIELGDLTIDASGWGCFPG